MPGSSGALGRQMALLLPLLTAAVHVDDLPLPSPRQLSIHEHDITAFLHFSMCTNEECDGEVWCDNKCLVDFCVKDSVSCPPPAGQCYGKGMCDPRTGECQDIKKAYGAPCDDGDVLSQNDRCYGGECRGQDLCLDIDCTAARELECREASVCNQATGKCDTGPVAPDNPCGQDLSGVCTKSGCCARQELCLYTECGDLPKDQCHHEGECDLCSGDCIHWPVEEEVECDDGLFYTVDDLCHDGTGVCRGLMGCDGTDAEDREMAASQAMTIVVDRYVSELRFQEIISQAVSVTTDMVHVKNETKRPDGRHDVVFLITCLPADEAASVLTDLQRVIDSGTPALREIIVQEAKPKLEWEPWCNALQWASALNHQLTWDSPSSCGQTTPAGVACSFICRPTAADEEQLLQLYGDETVTCGSDGQWSAVPLVCMTANCADTNSPCLCLPDHVPCDDGDPETIGDVCMLAKCSGTKDLTAKTGITHPLILSVVDFETKNFQEILAAFTGLDPSQVAIINTVVTPPGPGNMHPSTEVTFQIRNLDPSVEDQTHDQIKDMLKSPGSEHAIALRATNGVEDLCRYTNCTNVCLPGPCDLDLGICGQGAAPLPDGSLCDDGYPSVGEDGNEVQDICTGGICGPPPSLSSPPVINFCQIGPSLNNCFKCDQTGLGGCGLCNPGAQLVLSTRTCAPIKVGDDDEDNKAFMMIVLAVGFVIICCCCVVMAVLVVARKLQREDKEQQEREDADERAESELTENSGRPVSPTSPPAKTPYAYQPF
eukprot:gene1733-2898_t